MEERFDLWNPAVEQIYLPNIIEVLSTYFQEPSLDRGLTGLNFFDDFIKEKS